MSPFLPVGGGARNEGGAELIQPVCLDGVASTYRFPRRHWRIRHTVFGLATDTDRSRRRQFVLAIDEPGQSGRATQERKATKGVDKQ